MAERLRVTISLFKSLSNMHIKGNLHQISCLSTTPTPTLLNDEYYALETKNPEFCNF